jgi:hypothetical protein
MRISWVPTALQEGRAEEGVVLSAKNAQLPAPAKKRNTMNMAMFWAAQRHTPPIIDSVAQYITPTFLPYLSITQLPTKTPKNAPAFPFQKSQLPGSTSQPLRAYLKDTTSCADEGIGIRA